MEPWTATCTDPRVEALNRAESIVEKQQSPGANSGVEVKTMEITSITCVWPENDWILTSEGYTNPGLEKVQGDMNNYIYILTKEFHTREIM